MDKNKLTNEEIDEKHQKLREILESYGSPEFGDAIIDEICNQFNFPNTIDLERVSGNLKT